MLTREEILNCAWPYRQAIVKWSRQPSRIAWRLDETRRSRLRAMGFSRNSGAVLPSSARARHTQGMQRKSWPRCSKDKRTRRPREYPHPGGGR